MVALLLVFAASGAVLVALRPFNSAALGALELVATLAPLTSFACALGVLGSRGASDSTRCVCGVVYMAGRWQWRVPGCTALVCFMALPLWRTLQGCWPACRRRATLAWLYGSPVAVKALRTRC